MKDSLVEGTILWVSPLHWWSQAKGKSVGEHPAIILAVDRAAGEMTLILGSSEEPADGEVAVTVTSGEFGSAFKPRGILGHKTYFYVKSQSGECLPIIKASFPESNCPFGRVILRSPKLLEERQWKDLATRINNLLVKIDW